MVTGLVLSTPFLSQAAVILDTSLLNTKFVRLLAEWCLSYHKEYSEAPGHHIWDTYHSWAEEHEEEEDLAEMIYDYLDSLIDGDVEKDVNVSFLVDELASLMNHRKTQRLQEHLEFHMGKGDLQGATQEVIDFKMVEAGLGHGCDPLRDTAPWAAAYAEMQTPLLNFGAAGGKFFDAAMTRDSLIGIQAPEKTGKTFWCVEFMFRALRERRKVAFFQVGDLSENQMLRRMGTRLSNRPMWERQLGEVEVPIKIERDDEEGFGYRIITEPKKCTKVADAHSSAKGMKRLRRAVGMAKGASYFKLSVHANNSINVRGISGILDRWVVDEGFVPDVIIIDYADILAPEESRSQGRDIVNATWKALRKLSQERHALVIVPTQADARSYDAKLQDMSHFSEDKRKFAHVTGMLALNQTPEEKEVGGMRLNWIVLREAPFNIRRPLCVATCFTLGKALCCATM